MAISPDILNYRIFPKFLQPTNPDLYFEKIAPDVNRARNEVYICYPYTTGGEREKYEHLSKRELQAYMPEIMRKNGSFAELNALLLADLIGGRQVAVPHHMGDIPGYQALDYMLNCLGVIAGPTVDTHRRFVEKVMSGKVIDRDIFNNSTGDKRASRLEHLKFAERYANHLVTSTDAFNPLDRLFLLPYHNKSNGCSAEVLLSDALGVPMQEVRYDPHHPDFRKIVFEAADWITIGENPPHLVPNGGIQLINLRPYSHTPESVI